MRQRNIPHVGKCKRRSGSVTSLMLASAREDAAAYHPACWQVQEKMRQRNIPYVGKCQRRCGSVPSRMLASAREDSAAAARQRTIPHVGRCKRRCCSVPPACWQVEEKMRQCNIPMLASAREDAAAAARQRTIPHVGKCKRRCGSVISLMWASAREHCVHKNAEKRTLLPPHRRTPMCPPYKTLRAVGEKRPQLAIRCCFQSLEDVKTYKLSGAPSARVTKRDYPLVN